MRFKKFIDCRVLAVVCATVLFNGCETSDNAGGYSHTYYGTGFYDPWFYGDVYHDDIVVTPPDRGPRPSHPIASPPGGGAGARPMPMPSIPSMPRGGRR